MSNDQYKNAKWEKHPSGYILVDNKEVAHTLQCCHCNTHFLSIKGSGTRRGFCMLCMKVTCGHPSCAECVPSLAKIDFLDKGQGLKSKKWDGKINDLTKKFGDLRY